MVEYYIDHRFTCLKKIYFNKYSCNSVQIKAIWASLSYHLTTLSVPDTEVCVLPYLLSGTLPSICSNFTVTVGTLFKIKISIQILRDDLENILIFKFEDLKWSHTFIKVGNIFRILLNTNSRCYGLLDWATRQAGVLLCRLEACLFQGVFYRQLI